MPGETSQLTFSAPIGDWRLSSAKPTDDLRDGVVEYWEVEGTLSAFREALLPNGTVELMMNLGPPHCVLDHPDAGIWTFGWFSGLQERALSIETLDGTHLISARLHPVGAAAFFGDRVASGVNRIIDIRDFIGHADASSLRTRLLAASSPAERFTELEAFLRPRRLPTDPVPVTVREAARRIEAAHGNLAVARLHEMFGTSRKHLAVLFRQHVGLSLKAYAKIQRFVWTINEVRQRTSVSWSQLAEEAGYSDQSHLVRDFRRIGAATPMEYLRQRTPEGDALLYEAGTESG